MEVKKNTFVYSYQEEQLFLPPLAKGGKVRRTLERNTRTRDSRIHDNYLPLVRSNYSVGSNK